METCVSNCRSGRNHSGLAHTHIGQQRKVESGAGRTCMLAIGMSRKQKRRLCLHQYKSTQRIRIVITRIVLRVISHGFRIFCTESARVFRVRNRTPVSKAPKSEGIVHVHIITVCTSSTGPTNRGRRNNSTLHKAVVPVSGTEKLLAGRSSDAPQRCMLKSHLLCTFKMPIESC